MARGWRSFLEWEISKIDGTQLIHEILLLFFNKREGELCLTLSCEKKGLFLFIPQILHK